MDAEREAEKFRVYWRTIPGAKGLKLEWPLVWCTWVQNGIDRGNYARTAALSMPIFR
jgi:hypothetical protein